MEALSGYSMLLKATSPREALVALPQGGMTIIFSDCQLQFLSTFYMNYDGVRALVVTEDNQVHEVNPYDLSLPTAEYNKIFTE